MSATPVPSLRQRLGRRLRLLARPRRPEPLPIDIDRRRVYILPTGFGLFLATVVMAMLLGALNYNNNPGLLLACLLAAAIHNSFVRAHLNLSGVGLLALAADPVHAGGRATLRYLLRGDEKRERLGLRLSLDGAETTVGLAPGERRECRIDVPAPRRGWLRPERLRLDTRQPHGLAMAWCWFWPDTRILVYPALEAAAPPLPVSGGSLGQRWRIGQGEELHHLRDYRVGDPLREVAWKASARLDRLLVREHETTRGADVSLDWQATAGLACEARIRRLASWVVEAERRGLRYRLSLPGWAIGFGQGGSHRHACLKALALMASESP